MSAKPPPLTMDSMVPQPRVQTTETSKSTSTMNRMPNNNGWNTGAPGSGGLLNSNQGPLNDSFNQFMLQQQLQQQQQQQQVPAININKISNNNLVQVGKQQPMKAFSSPFDLSFNTPNDSRSTNLDQAFQSQPNLNKIVPNNTNNGDTQTNPLFLMQLQQNMLRQQQQHQHQQQLNRQLQLNQQQQQHQQVSLQSQDQQRSQFFLPPTTVAPTEQDQRSKTMIDQYKDVFGDLRVFEPNTTHPSRNNGCSSEPQSPAAPSNRILLGSKVEPFTRFNNQDVEDDLFKLFEEEDGVCAATKPALQQHQQRQEMQSSPQDLTPLPLQQSNQGFSKQQLQYDLLQKTFQAHTQQLQNQDAHNSASQAASETLQKHDPQDFALLRQQEQLEEARMQKLCQVDGVQPSQQPSQPAQLDEPDDDEFSGQYFVPSTMMPPSVLASTLSPCSQKRKTGDENSGKASRRKRPRKAAATDEPSPQKLFEQMVENAGFRGTKRIKSDDAEYEVVPSALQLASFGTHLVKAVHTSDEKALSDLLRCGLSPNPCNQFRDSVVDLVCKRGNSTIFQCLLDHGSDLQTVDGFGRTPLHHCCWASTFSRPIVDAILERDPIQLMIEDKHGQTPLEYVRTDLASDWIEYLEANIYNYWGSTVPQLSSPKPNRPGGTLPDPQNSIPVNLASLVSAGKITPEQVIPMIEKRNAKLALS